MKIKNSIVSLAACVAAVTFTGCSKSNETAADSSTATNTATETMAAAADTVTETVTNAAAAVTDAAKDVADKTADTAKDVAAKVADAVTPAAPQTDAAVATATSKFNDIVAKAKTYIADKKYTDALTALNQLSGVVLTADQQKTVDDLKAEVTKLMSGGTSAVDAAKGLFGK